jgi:hypothetical protein
MHRISEHQRFIGRQLVQQCFIARDEGRQVRIVSSSRYSTFATDS